MYESFYKLNKKPFQISSDPAFMWFGEKHKEALATLKYGILDNKGFLLLTGDVGTGKTTLINALVQSLSDDVICSIVPDPGLEKLDFFNYIAASFGLTQDFTSKGSFLVHFRQFLLDANENGKKVLLIIDEAQLLTQQMLEEIRLLSNIEKTDSKLINIFFIGQNEFNEVISNKQNRAVRQRLTLNYNIEPLTPDETSEYIKHRLGVAGARKNIFDAQATQEVFLYAGGYPRRINVICDHCLLSGYVKDKKIITPDIVKECAKELNIPSHIKQRSVKGEVTYHEESIPTVKPPTETLIEQRISIPAEKSKVKLFVNSVFILFVLLIFWFVLFPDQFKNSMGEARQNLVNLKSMFFDSDQQRPDVKVQNTIDQQGKTDIQRNQQAFGTPKSAPLPDEDGGMKQDLIKRQPSNQMDQKKTTAESAENIRPIDVVEDKMMLEKA